jgi:hypothetical protein
LRSKGSESIAQQRDAADSLHSRLITALIYLQLITGLAKFQISTLKTKYLAPSFLQIL